ncbi:hypothetical protein STA3757_03120 [Stanieria sp. NIES-3757]|nr:hypothetical protein STA3757_03120 [Stanieria sp. NIES-3757]
MKLTKSRLLFLSFAILNILNILLINNKTHAQALDCNLSGVKKHFKNNAILTDRACQLNKSLTASTSPGSPTLRRIPNQGEQQFEPTRIPLRIPTYRTPYRAAPSVTIINPSGYGAAAGNVGIGVGFQERVRFKDDADGVIGLGFGLGNPQKNIGLQVGVSLVDVSDPFRDGAINLKLHRRLPSDFSLATGVQGTATWGDTDGGSSVYGVTTKRLVLQQDRSKPFSEIYASVGVGGGQFRSEDDIDNGVESVGVFGSLAVRVIEPINFITEWTGQDLTIGVSVVPFRNIPLVIVPAVTDITGAAGDGGRVILGVGYSISF